MLQGCVPPAAAMTWSHHIQAGMLNNLLQGVFHEHTWCAVASPGRACMPVRSPVGLDLKSTPISSSLPCNRQQEGSEFGIDGIRDPPGFPKHQHSNMWQ
jgi:hypothetical protein